jgi:hypothetical protein
MTSGSRWTWSTPSEASGCWQQLHAWGCGRVPRQGRGHHTQPPAGCSRQHGAHPQAAAPPPMWLPCPCRDVQLLSQVAGCQLLPPKHVPSVTPGAHPAVSAGKWPACLCMLALTTPRSMQTCASSLGTSQAQHCCALLVQGLCGDCATSAVPAPPAPTCAATQRPGASWALTADAVSQKPLCSLPVAAHQDCVTSPRQRLHTRLAKVGPCTSCSSRCPDPAPPPGGAA